tara:strand:- start:1327 stop:2613 length:1287 start_codon:yes stop_codon:yes gene_type:complete
MSTEFGNKLSPYRKLRKQRGIKGTRHTLFNTHVPATIDQNGILTVRFPDLGPNDVIVPGTAKLAFKIDLTSTSDTNRTIVNNLGRAIVSKIEVKLEGKSVSTLDDSDIFLCYQDLWKTSEERENAAYQGICSDAIRKIRIDAGDKNLSNVKNKAIGTTYSNRFSIPLDFELLTSHMPFFQHQLKDRLSYELTFASYGKVIVSTDNNASYTISDIHMEFETITSLELATMLRNQHKGKFTILYDRVQRHSKQSYNKQDTIWNISMAPSAKSMKGILILFVDPSDGGALYGRDSEKFYNPKINKVSITLDGNPNQLYASGMLKHQSWDEIRKHFADGKHRAVNSVAKDLELADITLADYLTENFGLWLDMRTTDDDSLHGSGRKLEGASQSIQVQIEKDAETPGALDAYIFYICDGQLNFQDSRMVHAVY